MKRIYSSQKSPEHRALQSLLVMVLLTCSTISHAATVNISANVWGSVIDETRDGVFDVVGADPAINAFNIAPDGVPQTNRGIWEFDLSELPGGSITSVSLFLDLISTTGGPPLHKIYQYAGDGTLSVGDESAGSLLATDITGDITIDVTSFVLDAGTLAAGYASYNVSLKSEFVNPTQQKFFTTPDSDFGNGPPWLIVE